MKHRAYLLSLFATATGMLIVGALSDPPMRQAEYEWLVEADVYRRLEEISSIHAVRMPLDAVLQELAQRHDLSIDVDFDALRDVGLTGREPVSLEIPEIRLKCLLRWLLAEFEHCYVVRDGGLTVTTPEAALSFPEKMYGRVYPLPPPAFRLQTVGSRQVHRLITTYTVPYDWADVGGRGEIVELPNAIAVVHTASVHVQIESLLADLQRGSQLQDSLEAIPLLPHRSSHLERRIEKRLDQPAHLDFVRASLADACQFLQQQYGVPVVIDRQAMDDVGLQPTLPITIDIWDVTLREELRRMLAEFELTFVVRDDVLLITTPEEAETLLEQRLYPIWDLTQPNGPFSMGALENLLTSMVAPLDWSDVGGCGEIVPFGSEYVLISQTQAVHKDIEEWLAQLRNTLTPTTASPHTSVLPSEVARIEALLEQPARLAYHEAALETIVKDIEKRYNLDIGIDTVILDRVNNGWLTVAAKHVVRCDLNEPTLESALRKMLVPLGLDFEIRGGMVWICAATEVDQDEWYAVYDARALVDPDFGLFTEAELLRLVRVSSDWQTSYNWALSEIEIDDKSKERYFFGGLMIFTAPWRQHRQISKAVQFYNGNLATLRELAERTKARDANADQILLETVRSGRRPWECVYAALLLANQQSSLSDDVRAELRTVNDSLDPLADETLHRVLNWMLDGEASP